MEYREGRNLRGKEGDEEQEVNTRPLQVNAKLMKPQQIPE
jgi:hypothetical protein